MAEFGKRGLSGNGSVAGMRASMRSSNSVGMAAASGSRPASTAPTSRPYAATSPSRAQTSSFDEGLRAHMLGVYNLMMLGVAFSGIVTLVLVLQPELLDTLTSNPLFGLTIFLGTFGLSWCAPMIIQSGSPAVGHVFYWLYCTLWGAGLAPLLSYLIEADASQIIAQAFFLAASLFGAASLYGYTTRRDLTGWGAFLCMMCFGLIAAAVLNILVFEWNGLCFLLSVATVIIFTAVTAWETQAIKDSYAQAHACGTLETYSIFGAFQLYGSFMMIFSRLLRILYCLQND